MIRKSLLIEGLEGADRAGALTRVLAAIPGAHGIKVSCSDNRCTLTVPEIIDDATIMSVVARFNCKVISILDEIGNKA